MKLNTYIERILITFLIVALAGCAAPKIDTTKFTQPKVVVISDIPDIKPSATIKIVTTNFPEPYFSGYHDNFFDVTQAPPSPSTSTMNSDIGTQVARNQINASPKPVSVVTGAALGAVSGFVGGLIDSGAARTEMRAAEFPSIVGKTLNTDIRTSFLKAISEGLSSNGIEARFISDTRNNSPRLRWQAQDENGKIVARGEFPDSPPIDADILAHISPITIYAAPGPLNSYTPKVGIGLAMFDARTRKFIGWQAFSYTQTGSKFDYVTYDGLVADVKNAGPVLNDALLSLVPKVVKVISGQP